MWESVLYRINNIRVRNKLILLYLLAVFIPVVLTNSVFYQSISDSLNVKQSEDIKVSIERMQEHLNKKFQECLLITNVIYTDSKVNEALEKQYSSVNAYLEEYRGNLVNSVGKYMTVYPQIAGISVYARNPTIISGAEFVNANERIVGSSWYQAIANSNENTLLYSYLDSEGIQSVSLLRKLDYFTFVNRVEKVLKLDIRWEAIYEEIKNEKLVGDVHLMDEQGRIIASTDPKYNFNISKFRNFSTFQDIEHKKDEVVVSKRFDSSDFLKGWSIEVHVPKYNLLNALKHSLHFIIYLSVLNLVVPTMIILLLSQSFLSRIRTLSKYMKKLRDQQFEIIEKNAGEDELGQLTQNYNVLVNRMESLIKEVYETGLRNKSLEIESKQAQLHALQSQINPHFLFNTLETIRMRSLLKQEKETASIIQNMSSIFRKTLTWHDDMVPVAEEITFVEQFLEIQKYRFGSKIQYCIDVEEACKSVTIPKMCMQVFVENACVHGIEAIEGDGLITIKGRRNNDMLICEIEDNGIGMGETEIQKVNALIDGKEAPGKSYGIRNIVSRMKLIYGERFQIKLSSYPNKGTRVLLVIPQKS